MKISTSNYRSDVYCDRDSRNKFIVKELGNYLGRKILGAGGGGERHLAAYLPKDSEYVEIDIAGSPDILINLEDNMPLPFEKNTFDTIVCTDVLEHLDSFHEVLDELYRICSGNIIISLPNSSNIFINYLLQKKSEKN